MYQVFQDGKPADSFGYEDIIGWSESKYDTLEQAVTHALLWAYPYSLSQITPSMLNYFVEQFQQNNYEVDMGMFKEFPVIMSIREI